MAIEQIEGGGLVGVSFTAETYADVRQWVQDRSEQTEIVATASRLYLPVGKAGMATVDENDVIWWDPEGGPNAFSIERFL